MKTRLWSRLTAGVAVLGVLGAAALYFFWDPRKDYEEVPNAAASTVTDDVLQQAAQVRFFFGHKSVGKNVLSGVEDVYAANGIDQPRVIEIPVGDQAPELGDGGALLHTSIGENGDPKGKLENFATMLQAGVGAKVDVALLKFCYVDIRWNTDVEALFADYKATVAELEREFPDVRFVHATVPLTVGPEGIKDAVKVLVGRDDNAARARYNDLVRSTYSTDRVFDLAAAESTTPDGENLTSLYPGYSSDGAHLNASGSAIVAVELLELVAGPDRA